MIGLGSFSASLARRLEVMGHQVLGLDRDIGPVQTISDDITSAVALDVTLEDALGEVRHFLVQHGRGCQMAQLGFAKVLVNHNSRKIHDAGVMAHLIRVPYIMFFQPMMEELGGRYFLP